MKTFAVLQDNIVINLVVAQSAAIVPLAQDQTAVEVPTEVFVDFGCIYDSETNTFAMPTQPAENEDETTS
jgi:hypothetical protein